MQCRFRLHGGIRFYVRRRSERDECRRRLYGRFCSALATITSLMNDWRPSFEGRSFSSMHQSQRVTHHIPSSVHKTRKSVHCSRRTAHHIRRTASESQSAACGTRIWMWRVGTVVARYRRVVSDSKRAWRQSRRDLTECQRPAPDPQRWTAEYSRRSKSSGSLQG
jgi:hypothetical protein